MSPLLILSTSKSENVWTSQRNVLGIQHRDPHQCERFPACGSRSAGPHAPRPRQCAALLTHWGRVTHICVGNLTIIGSDNGLSPGRCQAIIWTNAGILLIGPLGTNFSEILIDIDTFSFKKITWDDENVVWKITAILSRPQCVKSVYCSRLLHRHSRDPFTSKY